MVRITEAPRALAHHPMCDGTALRSCVTGFLPNASPASRTKDIFPCRRGARAHTGQDTPGPLPRSRQVEEYAILPADRIFAVRTLA